MPKAAPRRRRANGITLQNNKRPRLEVKPRIKLKTYGDLWKIVHERGALPQHIKTLLERTPPKERREYLTTDNQGWKLLSAVCVKGNIDDIRYAIEKLKLNKLPVDAMSDLTKICPLCTMLGKEAPEPNLIWYLVAQGCPVWSNAFRYWAALRCSKAQLHRLLEPLIKFGRSQMPPPIELIGLASVEHVEVLRAFVTFTVEEVYLAAHLDNTGVISHMDLDRQPANEQEAKKLADMFDVCEVSRNLRGKRPFMKLSYFRKSLQYKQSANADVKDLAFGPWKLFKSAEDIDRLDSQLAEDDYVETAWQIILSAAKYRFPLEEVSLWLFREEYITDIDELLRIKSFVLDTDAFLRISNAVACRDEKKSFLAEFTQYCIGILSEIQRPPVTLLPKLYHCFWDAMEDRTQHDMIIAYLKRALFRMDTANLDAQLNEVARWRDECLFIIALTYDTEFSRKSTESIILSLLRRDASLLIQPGQDKSTLFHLLRGSIKVPERLRQELVARTCCRVDLEERQRALLNMNEPHLKVSPLRCLASIACRALPRTIREETLPATLVPFTQGHPNETPYIEMKIKLEEANAEMYHSD